MNLQDQVIYRCIHAACARSMPRKVNFCPYCGTGQHDGVINHAHVARPAQAEYREAQAAVPVELAKPVSAPAAAAAAAAAPAAAAPATAGAAAAPLAAGAAPSAPAGTPPPSVPPPSAQLPPAAPPKARGGVPAAPPRREPVRLRYWLIVLASLWLIWLYAKPSTRKIDNKIESAIAATEECRLNDAQSALLELRITKATDKQLERVQSAIKTAEASCGKKLQREKAWTDTVTAVEAALDEGEFAKAQARLNAFTKKYNEDGETRKLKDKIGVRRSNAAAAAPVIELPPPRVERVPAPSGQTSQSVRNLISEAERALQAGNYQAASDKLETCITMVDQGNRECQAFKVHADRMVAEKQRCLAAGRAWYEDRCR